MIDDSQIWLIIGVIVGAVAVLVLLGVLVSSYITNRRLANILSDVEEIIHADLKRLEEKIETALARIRISDAKANRD